MSDTKAPPCECGHDANQHGATGICLFGYNAAVAQYSEGRHGERKCACESYRPSVEHETP